MGSTEVITKSFRQVWTAGCLTFSTFLAKLPSRKFLVWVIATHMAYLSLLDAGLWFTISAIFMGIQGALDWKDKTTDDHQNAREHFSPNE